VEHYCDKADWGGYKNVSVFWTHGVGCSNCNNGACVNSSVVQHTKCETKTIINYMCNSSINSMDGYGYGNTYSCGGYCRKKPQPGLLDAPDIIYSNDAEFMAYCGGMPGPDGLPDPEICNLPCESQDLCSNSSIPKCGNSIIELDEECDTNETRLCSSFESFAPWKNPTAKVSCTNCQWNLSVCSTNQNNCGNGILDGAAGCEDVNNKSRRPLKIYDAINLQSDNLSSNWMISLCETYNSSCDHEGVLYNNLYNDFGRNMSGYLLIAPVSYNNPDQHDPQILTLTYDDNKILKIYLPHLVQKDTSSCGNCAAAFWITEDGSSYYDRDGEFGLGVNELTANESIHQGYLARSAPN
jgi:hypothetical protein